MRQVAIGFPLAGAAAAVLALGGSVPARADLILPASEPAESAPGAAADGAPVYGDADVGGGSSDVRLGYALTWDEFVGGFVMLGATVGGAFYLANAANNKRL